MSAGSHTLLALNVGSTSLKAAGYAWSNDAGAASPLPVESARVEIETAHASDATPEAAADAALADVARRWPPRPDVVVHRIVHGADRAGPTPLTPATLDQLQALSAWAPLHQPPALALVHAAIRRWPDARQVGVFDTSWHRTMAEEHRTLPLRHALHALGVKRYGFHGLAFQSALRQLAGIDAALSKARVVLAHLGGGSSVCAVRFGHSVNTTMGMTPLGGIAMASRPGSLDPGVVLHLQRGLGMSPAQIDELLWHDSGLKGLSGESGDMRTLLASDSDGARRAIAGYVAGVVQGIAAMAASVRGIDALVFSGGIGTHAAEIRGRICDELAWMGVAIGAGLPRAGPAEISAVPARVRTFVLAVDEEREMVDAWVARQREPSGIDP